MVLSFKTLFLSYHLPVVWSSATDPLHSLSTHDQDPPIRTMDGPGLVVKQTSVVVAVSLSRQIEVSRTGLWQNRRVREIARSIVEAAAVDAFGTAPKRTRVRLTMARLQEWRAIESSMGLQVVTLFRPMLRMAPQLNTCFSSYPRDMTHRSRFSRNMSWLDE
jgi:hypothetical protein